MDTLFARDKGTIDTGSAFFGVGPPVVTHVFIQQLKMLYLPVE